MDRTNRGQFPPTPWTLVAKAARSGEAGARAALGRLCADYWYPLYVFARRRGHSAEDAQDLVQGFFARFIERDHLSDRNPANGRFRSYLLTAFTNFATNERLRAGAAKRRAMLVSLDVDLADGERRLRFEPVTQATPEAEFERKWALALLERALELLATEYKNGGRSAEFETLREFLPGARATPDYAEAARAAGVRVGTMKTRVSRLRRRYRELLRSEVARTVAGAEDVESEIRFLARILGR